MDTGSGRLTTDFALMRDVAAATDERSAEIRAMLGGFIARVGAVPGIGVERSGRGAVPRRRRPGGMRSRPETVLRALDDIAATIRTNERLLHEAALAHEGPHRGSRRRRRGDLTVDPVLSDFAEIEFSVRQEIHTTSARLNAALEDLRSRIAPLRELWTRNRRGLPAGAGPLAAGRDRVIRHPCCGSAAQCRTAPVTSPTPTAAPPTPGGNPKTRGSPGRRGPAVYSSFIVVVTTDTGGTDRRHPMTVTHVRH